MVPSSFIISQMMLAGTIPASLARSTEASVWPARTSTPPLRARNGNMWPGLARSNGRVFGSIATLMVCARSCAEIPVVMPSRASIASQKAVPYCEVFSLVMGPMRRWSRRSSVMARQTRPRPCRAMKLIASGVTLSAASVRSPSFSRSSSSITTIIRPARISSIAVGTSVKGELGVIRRLLPQGLKPCLCCIWVARLKPRPFKDPAKRKGSLAATLQKSSSLRLQGRFDFKTPSFQQGLGDVLGILVAACPFTQTCGPQILVGGELVLVHNLLEFGDCGSNRPDGFGLAPVGVSASLSHEKYTL